MLDVAVVFLWIQLFISEEGQDLPAHFTHRTGLLADDVNDDWPPLSCIYSSVKGVMVITISTQPSEFIAAAKMPLRAMNTFIY